MDGDVVFGRDDDQQWDAGMLCSQTERVRLAVPVADVEKKRRGLAGG